MKKSYISNYTIFTEQVNKKTPQINYEKAFSSAKIRTLRGHSGEKDPAEKEPQFCSAGAAGKSGHL